jgi:hypothetical protein
VFLSSLSLCCPSLLPLGRRRSIIRVTPGWAKFAVGSSATYTGEVAAAGFKGTVESVYKLAEKTDDHVAHRDDQHDDHGRQHAGDAGAEGHDQIEAEKADVKELGKEDIEAAGKKYACTIYELGGIMPQAKDAKLKAWVNDDIPVAL